MTTTLDLTAIRVAPAKAPLEVGMPEDLTPTDLEAFANALKPAQRPLQKITERHHMAARLLALGTQRSAVSVITGYHKQTLALLLDDPAFQELMAFYSADIDDSYRAMRAQLLGMGDDALQEIRKRIEEDPDKVSFKDLLSAVQLVADRTGNGPSSTSVNVDVKVGIADKMRLARERADAASSAKDITPSEAAE